MIESHVAGPVICPTIAAQRNCKLARHRPGANNPRPETNKNSRQKSRILLDTPLSSNPVFANSTRHSVTSRIESNLRFFSYLIFSTRHLNATLEKRDNVEKFNTCLRFDFDRETRVPEPLENPFGPKDVWIAGSFVWHRFNLRIRRTYFPVITTQLASIARWVQVSCVGPSGTNPTR